MSIIIYTDGSAKGNPGNGGYGIVMISGVHRKEIQKGFIGFYGIPQYSKFVHQILRIT